MIRLSPWWDMNCLNFLLSADLWGRCRSLPRHWDAMPWMLRPAAVHCSFRGWAEGEAGCCNRFKWIRTRARCLRVILCLELCICISCICYMKQKWVSVEAELISIIPALFFRNYVVQYVIDLKVPTANASLTKQFQGRYIHLSMQKFSSNVVEKCLKVFKEADKATIILELLAVPHFEQLLQHPFANYVIYSAIQNSKVKHLMQKIG